MVANHAPWFIGINLHVDSSAVVAAGNARFHIHLIHDLLNIVRYVFNYFFDIIVCFDLDA